MKKLLVIALLICLLLSFSGCYTPSRANVDVGDYNGNDFLSKIDNDTPLSQILLPAHTTAEQLATFLFPQQRVVNG